MSCGKVYSRNLSSLSVEAKKRKKKKSINLIRVCTTNRFELHTAEPIRNNLLRDGLQAAETQIQKNILKSWSPCPTSCDPAQRDYKCPIKGQ